MLPILMLLALLLITVLGCPVAFGLGGLAFIFGFFGGGLSFLSIFADKIYSIVSNQTLIAVPLFVGMGSLIEASGIAKKLFDVLFILLGRIKGGLAIGVLGLATLFGACTATVGASVITIGLIALPTLLSKGYSKEIATGTILAGGGLGVIIPPSVLLILYGPLAGVSIAKLFMACLLPGVTLGILYMGYVYVRCSINPEMGGVISVDEREMVSTKELTKMILVSVAPTLLLIMAVLGSIFFGVVSPSEAGAMGFLGATILILAYKKCSLETAKKTMLTTIRVCSMVMYILIGAGLFTSVFLYLGGGEIIKSMILAMPMGKMGSLIFMLFIILVLGMIMDWVGMMLIVIPIFTPIVTGLGFDQLWFGVLFCITLQISYLTPPFAYSVFFLKGISPEGVKISHMYKGSIPFIIIQVLFIIFCISFPQFVLWLPNY